MSKTRRSKGPRKRKRSPGVRAEGVIKPVRLMTLDDLDRRSTTCRYALGLKDGFISDLGGVDNTTVAQRELAQRASILGAVIEDAETKWLRGDPVEFGQYCALVNCQRRVLADIGLERRQRDITPSLGQYLTVKKADKKDEPDNE
jgi:hypothetical protein